MGAGGQGDSNGGTWASQATHAQSWGATVTLAADWTQAESALPHARAVTAATALVSESTRTLEAASPPATVRAGEAVLSAIRTPILMPPHDADATTPDACAAAAPTASSAHGNGHEGIGHTSSRGEAVATVRNAGSNSTVGGDSGGRGGLECGTGNSSGGVEGPEAAAPPGPPDSAGTRQPVVFPPLPPPPPPRRPASPLVSTPTAVAPGTLPATSSGQLAVASVPLSSSPPPPFVGAVGTPTAASALASVPMATTASPPPAPTPAATPTALEHAIRAGNRPSVPAQEDKTATEEPSAREPAACTSEPTPPRIAAKDATASAIPSGNDACMRAVDIEIDKPVAAPESAMGTLKASASGSGRARVLADAEALLERAEGELQAAGGDDATADTWARLEALVARLDGLLLRGRASLAISALPVDSAAPSLPAASALAAATSAMLPDAAAQGAQVCPSLFPHVRYLPINTALFPSLFAHGLISGGTGEN